VFERWRTHHPDDTVLTVVTASGGGIRAAGWTAEVLTRLDEASDGAFGRSLLLISSVSGGSVGAMYYVDRYGEGEGARTHIRRESTRSSLYGTAWGLVYGDVWRWLPFGGNRDRGRALERIWAQRLATDSTTIWDWWRDDNAWRPFHIHNATIAETGDRMLLAAVDSVGDANTFSGLYPENDLRVATAARLSATFPYVSPLARPRVRKGVPAPTAYRLGDGGYFDNHGVATAIDVLNDVLDSNRGIKHVLFVQVRSSVAEEREAEIHSGGTYALLGPILTLLRMRSAAQLDRNASQLEQLRALWNETDPAIQITPVGFVFEEELSLSWHLSKSEIQAFEGAWTRSKENQAACRFVLKMLNATASDGPETDPAVAEDRCSA
ncbi:MAG: hypothetical protein GVY25_04405, partial [Bacteroidetes bacterium]|nr:hypothetical protein [Bacteroidota bacterium]